MAIEVTWDSKVCIHSGNCVKTLPSVFKVENGKFVIEPSAAREDEVRRREVLVTRNRAGNDGHGHARCAGGQHARPRVFHRQTL